MTSLFPIAEEYADMILSGEKEFEYKKQNVVSVERGEKCYIYVPGPVKAVEGFFIIGDKLRMSADKLWERTRGRVNETRGEFYSYLGDQEEATALEIDDYGRIKPPVTLEELRQEQQGFHPPQTYMKLGPDLKEMLESKE